MRRLGDRGLAEEVVQDIFTRVWRGAESFDARRATVRTWIYGIARNAVIDSERRRSVRPRLATHAVEAEADVADGGEPVERAMLRWHVELALGRLSPEHRQVVRLAYFHGHTLREIAERTGLPLGTVKSRTSYALRSLRLILDEVGI